MCSTAGVPTVEVPRVQAVPALVRQLADVVDALAKETLTGLDGDSLAAVTEQLVRLENRLHARTLDAVAALDSAGVAAAGPDRTTRRWLERRTRLGAGACSRLVTSARALRDHLPATREALAAGQLTGRHVGEIARVVDRVGVEHARAAEPILLRLARRCDPAAVRRATQQLHAILDPEGAERSLHRVWEKRGVTLSVVGERAYLDGVIDVESAEVLASALLPLMDPGGDTDGRTAPQRRADALVDLARRALDAGDLPVTGGERPHLSVTVDVTTLTGGAGAGLLPWTGAAVPAGTVRRIACDGVPSTVLARLLGSTWMPLAVGRSARTVTTAQLRALRVRDGGCVHPGCSRTAAFCDAHHVRHWADGGATDLDNLLLLCRHHHRTLHAGEWHLLPDPSRPGLFRVRDRRGVEEAAQTAGHRAPFGTGRPGPARASPAA